MKLKSFPVALLASLVVATASFAVARDRVTAAVNIGYDPAAETTFVDLVNAKRAEVGAPPLTVDPELSANARAWCEEMKRTGALHHAADQSPGLSTGWSLLGENVGVGPAVPSLFAAFVASPSHYENMVDPAYTRIGIGVLWDGERMWTVQRYLAPSLGAPPAEIPQPDPVPPSTAPAPATAPAETTIPAPPTTRAPVPRPASTPAPVPPAAPSRSRPQQTTTLPSPSARALEPGVEAVALMDRL